MEKLQIDCEQYKLYSPDSLRYITDNMHEILISKIEEYKSLFDVDNLCQFQINYFDDLDKFREFIYDLRGEKKSLPEYARGTYDNGMVNAYIQNNIIVGSPLYDKRLYMASHEIFHIMYMRYILKNDHTKRIIWYDEGMAQFMSGEKHELLDFDNFKNFYMNVKDTTKIIPNMNEITHGDSFCNENYNGYDLSYLAIRYLNEVLHEVEFKELMSNFKRIESYGKNILQDMFEYYENKFKSKII